MASLLVGLPKLAIDWESRGWISEWSVVALRRSARRPQGSSQRPSTVHQLLARDATEKQDPSPHHPLSRERVRPPPVTSLLYFHRPVSFLKKKLFDLLSIYREAPYWFILSSAGRVICLSLVLLGPSITPAMSSRRGATTLSTIKTSAIWQNTTSIRTADKREKNTKGTIDSADNNKASECSLSYLLLSFQGAKSAARERERRYLSVLSWTRPTFSFCLNL